MVLRRNRSTLFNVRVLQQTTHLMIILNVLMCRNMHCIQSVDSEEQYATKPMINRNAVMCDLTVLHKSTGRLFHTVGSQLGHARQCTRTQSLVNRIAISTTQFIGVLVLDGLRQTSLKYSGGDVALTLNGRSFQLHHCRSSDPFTKTNC